LVAGVFVPWLLLYGMDLILLAEKAVKRIEHTLAIEGANRLYIRLQRLLGHAYLQMATRYVQDVSVQQTDKVIENSREYVV